MWSTLEWLVLSGKRYVVKCELFKRVIPSVAPGVSTEKDRISKVTPDMKGCYALVYRRRSEADEQVPEVPEHIEEIVALKAVVQVFSDMNTNGVVVLNSMRSHRNVYRFFSVSF